EPVSPRLNPVPQPRVIPAAYHPRAAVLPLRLKATSRESSPGKPMVTRASAQPKDLPGQETFVVVETTQYDSSGSGVWTLCIWRIRGGQLAARQLQSVVAPKI